MSVGQEATINGVFFVLAPIILAAILYIIIKLPATWHTTMYRLSVICLLSMIIVIQWLMWSDIQKLPISVEEQRLETSQKEVENTMDIVKKLWGM